MSRESSKGLAVADKGLSRRDFMIGVGTAGGGLAISVAVGTGLGLHTTDAQAVAEQGEISAWVYIRPDDTVLIRIVRAESGQGTLTGLAQLVAEELECDWVRVNVEYPTPSESLARNRPWGSFTTVGSRSIRDSQDYLRRGGAVARTLLVQAAARAWGVPIEECTVHRGVITHTPSNRKTVYGRVAYAASLLTPPKPESIQLKEPKNWKLLGQRMLRLDTFLKTNGGQDYATDLNFKDIYHAAIKVCPVAGGRVKRFEPKEAQERPGVQRVLRIGNNAVAVVANSWWRAQSALDQMSIEWDVGPNANVQQSDIEARLRAALADMPTSTVHHHGGAPAAVVKDIHETERRVDAVYSYPAQHHATMEPMSATARWTRTGCIVWAPTQDAEAALAAVAAVAELPIDKCEFHRLVPGGSFGRRAYHDVIVQAVQIARNLPGSVIKLAWSREEDMLHGPIHPPSMARLSASLSRTGAPRGLHLRIAGSPITLPRNPYDPPNAFAQQRAFYMGLLPEPTALPDPSAFDVKDSAKDGKTPVAPDAAPVAPTPSATPIPVPPPQSAAPTTAQEPPAEPPKKGGFFSFLFGGKKESPAETPAPPQAPVSAATASAETPAAPAQTPVPAAPAQASNIDASQVAAPLPRTTGPVTAAQASALLTRNDSACGYRFDQLLIDHVQRDLHVPTGWWRGAHLNPNTFYLESFIDEIAAATSQDPLGLRRTLLAGNPRRLAVLEAVARQVGWGKPAPAGVHRGLAQVMGMGSYLAACAEVSVSQEASTKGRLKIHRFVVAIDCGHAVNPQQIEAQIESSLAFGLSAALYGKISFQNGAVQQQNLDRYHVLRLADMPPVQTLVMPSGGFWGGVSEPATALAAPALCNAIFAATGKRIRELPLNNQLST
ncbi:molybdopterin cofactor-binding domain-containing protein [Hylemonella sp. W303a]|uniref:xanthine dehydrogenase family protein molybdopterin-binding subunit n=1 Tax=Hylemonella sp. W303a TaxID=3389873 RepID=UPI00396B2F85